MVESKKKTTKAPAKTAAKKAAPKKAAAKKTPAKKVGNKKHSPIFNYVNQFLIDNSVSQKIINNWEKDEAKLNKFMKNQEKKNQGKKLKDPNAPKKPQSAYMVYCNKSREDIKKANPDAPTTEIMKLLGAGWRQLTDKQKVPYAKEAAKLKEAYLKEMETYVPDEKYVTKKVDKDKPKRAKTNYIFFCQETRPEVIKENPDMKATDILIELGSRWKQLSDKEKEPYNKMAKKSKEEYDRNMEAYNNKNKE